MRGPVTIDEYLRRNTIYARSIGTHTLAHNTLTRLRKMKNTPLWLLQALMDLEKRTATFPPELQKFRDQLK